METWISIAQWAESGGQGDLGQFFIQNANFYEAWYKISMLPLPWASGYKKKHRSELSFEVLLDYTTNLWPIYYIFVPKLSQMIAYDYFHIINAFCMQFIKTKFWFSQPGFEPLTHGFMQNVICHKKNMSWSKIWTRVLQHSSLEC